MVAVGNRRHHGLFGRMTRFGLCAFRKEIGVKQSLDKQSLGYEPAAFVSPANAECGHRSKLVIAERHAETRRNLPMFAVECPAACCVTDIVFIPTKVVTLETKMAPKALDQSS